MKIPLRVLLIEDSDDDKELVLHELRRGGYDPEYECVETREGVYAALESQLWDIVLSDYSMPNFDGLSALKIIKEKALDIPFILISGTIGEDLAVTAMKSGAHDYIMKGNLNRLIPAIKREIKEADIRLQHKLAAKALRNSEEKFRIVVQNADALIITVHKDGIITLLEGKALRLLGIAAGQLVGQSVFEVYKDYPELIDQFNSALEGKATRAILKINEFLFECLFTPLFNSDDEFTSTIGVAVDITERIKLSENLRKLSAAVEQSQISIIITDTEARIEYVNPYFCKLTGYNREEVLNQNPRFLKSGETSEEKYSDMWFKLTSGTTWTGVFRNKKKNGELFWESAIITPIKNEAGIIVNYIAVKEDITEKIEKEIELKNYRDHLEDLVETRTEELDQLNSDLKEQLVKEKELEKMLSEALGKEKELNELKTRFISTASHEFRTPLTSVLSSAELILKYGKKWDEEKLIEHISRIKNSVEYLSKLLDDVLSMSRAESGKILLNVAPMNLHSLCVNIIEESQLQMSDKLKINFDYFAKDEMYRLDYKQLYTIVQNLLSNAIKYSPMGGLIKMYVISNDEKIQIIVSDEGIGIPNSDLPRLFEPFHRSANAIDIKGTGLGLSILKRAVELHNGEVRVESQLGKGTTFTVTIPL